MAQGAAYSDRRWRTFTGIGEELRLQAPFIVLVTVFMLAVFAISRIYDLESLFRITLYATMMRTSAIMTIPVAILMYSLYLGLVEKEPFPLRRLIHDLRIGVLTPHGLVGIGVPLCVMPFMVSAFSSFKSMIPLINPFHWDAAFYEADKWLHFGISPWRITHILFGDMYSTMIINFFYNLWIFIIWGFLFLHIYGFFGKRNRAHYILSFSLCWIVIGAICAFILSSGGPVYYGRLTGLENVYAPLMDRLTTIDGQLRPDGGYWGIWALSTQDYLWEQYQNSATTIGSGISAMPSMHVSIATLMALSARRTGRRFGHIMAAYAVIIMIGSVHLGWHYAIDGYLAFVLTLILWKLADRVIGQVLRGSGPRGRWGGGSHDQVVG